MNVLRDEEVIEIQHRFGYRLVRHPAQATALAFAVTIFLGAVLLSLPVSRSGDGSAPFLTALFTSTSAVCVTGLVTVDTGTYWSTFGQVVILALIQVGGFGIMTLASLLGLLVARRLGLRSRITAAAETKSLGIGEIRSVLVGVARITLLFEAIVALLLTTRFASEYDESLSNAAYLGVFHAISAFNNAGFGLYADSLMSFVNDPLICVPIATAVIFGGLGFPAVLELRRHLMPRVWSLHTKLTVGTTLLLLVLGTAYTLLGEWSNPATLAPMSLSEKIHAGFFHSAMTRTAGFNSLDISAMNEGTWFGTVILMFIGGGSAGTAGGIKVTTFIVLFFVILAEVRGDKDTNAFDRRIDPRAQRQAQSVALLGVGAVVAGTLTLMQTHNFSLGQALFEATSAFGTVGLSTGITPDLSAAGQIVVIALMFLGRLGPITLVSALALRQQQQRYRLPEGRPIIG
ncbi:TrkH family potassium uptake protein [Nocardioides sp. NPDC057772]|uniref:TrkH family potassium uptake protein n=1 Tax=Nocardioides sp. NPDC057772 TaxID=3346245 RepID=UPI00366FB50C